MSKPRNALRFTLVAAMMIAPTLAGQATAHAEPGDSPEARAAALIKPAVVYLEARLNGRVIDEHGTELNGGEPFKILVRCTGFAVKADGYIGTAGHCVDPEFQKSEIIRFAAESIAGHDGKSVDELVEHGNENWTVVGEHNDSAPDQEVLVSGAGQRGKDVTPLPARVLDVRPLGEGDVALLKVELGGKLIPAAELSADAAPQVGDPILAVGYPASTDDVTDFSLDPTVKSGTVSATETVETQPIFQVSAPMTQGMSGGPTVDLEGRVIGVNSFSPAGEDQAFNYISPVQGLKELLARNGVVPELSPADAAYRSGLDNYFEGNYTDAIANFDNALALSPQYPGAFEMRTDAVRLRAEVGDAGSGGPKPWMFVLAFVVTAALIGGGVLVFALSRRNKEPALPGGAGWPGEPGPSAPPRPQVYGAGGPAGPSPAGAPGPGPGGPPPPPASGGGEINCRNCGYGLSPGAQFCPRCGKPQG